MKNTVEIEKGIVATLLVEPGAYLSISDTISAEMFSDPFRPAMEYMIRQAGEGKGYDVGMVVTETKDRNLFSLIDLADPDLITDQAETLRDAYLSRQEVNICTDEIVRLNSGDPFHDVRASSQAAREEMLRRFDVRRSDKAARINAAVDRVQMAMSSQDGVSGLATGFSDLDSMTSGFQPGDLILLAARPGMGKTDHALEMCLNIAMQGHAVTFVSIEMSAEQIYTILGAKLAGMSRKAVLQGRLSKDQMDWFVSKMTEVNELPIEVIDDMNRFGRIRDELRRQKEKRDISFAVVDYLQLIEPDRRQSTVNYEVQEISRGLKNLAGQMQIPILSLAQLSRAVEARGGTKRPLPSDLRDSGSLEQDADHIHFLYRPEYYGIMEDEEGRSTKYITEYIVAKNRMIGELGTCLRRLENGRHVQHNYEIPAAAFDGLPAPSASGWERISAASGNDNDQDVPF